MISIRQILLISLCVIGAALLLYPKFWFPWTSVAGSDILSYHYPFYCSISKALQSGYFPFWFSESACGIPSIADNSLLMLVPFNLLLFFVHPITMVKALSMVYILLSFWGVYFWARCWSQSSLVLYGAAFYCIMSFQFHGLLHYGHFAFIPSFVYGPWLLFGAHRLTEQSKLKGYLRWTALIALCVSLLILSSHAQIAMISMEVASFYVLALLLTRKQKVLCPVWIYLFLGFIWGGIGALPQIMTTLQYLPETCRGIVAENAAMRDSGALGLSELTKWFYPCIYGGMGSYWGSMSFWFGQVFNSLFSLILVCYGLFRLPMSLRLVVLLFIILAMGSHTPIYDWHRDLIPGMSLFRFSSRYLFGLLPFFALGAGFGLKRVIESPMHRGIWLTGAVLLGLLYIIFHFGFMIDRVLPGHVHERFMQTNIQHEYIILFGAEALIVFTWTLSHATIRKSMVVVWVLLHIFISISLPFGGSDKSHSLQILGKESTEFQDERYATISPEQDERHKLERREIINPGSFYNASLENGYNGLSLYTGIIPRRFREFMDTQAPQVWTKQNRIQTLPLSDDARAFFSVNGYYPDQNSALKPQQYIAYNNKPLGFYFLTNDFFYPPLRPESIYTDKILTHQKELLDQFVNFYPKAVASTLDSQDHVEVVSYHPERVHLRVTTSQPAVLASSENNLKPWKVNVNGAEKEMRDWLGCFRSVFVDAGKHDVIFYYDHFEIYIYLIIGFSFIFLAMIFVCSPLIPGLKAVNEIKA
ncbi:MAG: YfhO family protein [Planctomycetes bacterium]|nr:YfhO family protein [Planctomycetota bacterium]